MWELLTFGKRPYENVPAREVHTLLEKGLDEFLNCFKFYENLFIYLFFKGLNPIYADKTLPSTNKKYVNSNFLKII